MIRKLIGLSVDDWPPGFASYATDKLNCCICARRGEIDKGISIRVKFIEDTLKKFKYGITE